jgi:DNA-binding response OmpR family regulator
VRLLLVEDDAGIAELLKRACSQQRYELDWAADGLTGLEMAEAVSYDLIILNLRLPKLDGVHLCQRLRAQRNLTPVLMLTAEASHGSIVTGLDMGADDYVVKPFDLEELLARVRALLRRGKLLQLPLMQWGQLWLDPSSCEVRYANRLLKLTPKEYALLELFLRNPQRIFSQTVLLDRLWSMTDSPSEGAVRAQMKGLRQKLKQVKAPELIETIYGLGYRLKPPPRPGTVQPDSDESKDESEQASDDLPMQASAQLSQEQPDSPQLAGLADLWQRYQPQYLDRLRSVEVTLAALKAGTLTQQQQLQAQQQMHTLSGSIGSFGLEIASQLATELEQTWRSLPALSANPAANTGPLTSLLSPALSPTQIDSLDRLAQQVQQLRQALLEPVFASRSSRSPLLPIVQDARLLIVDDDLGLVEQIAELASVEGMSVITAANLAQARTAIAYLRPDVVLLDLQFPDLQEDGFDLLAELVAYQPAIAVLLFTKAEAVADRVRAVRLGAKGFIQKPVAPMQVLDAIAQVLQQTSPPAAHLLVVDPELQTLDELQALLDPWGIKLTLIDQPQQIWQALDQTQPDLLLLAADLPAVGGNALSGLELCQAVRNDPNWGGLPIVLMQSGPERNSSKNNPERSFESNQAYAAGIDDLVFKPIDPSALVIRVLNRLERVRMRRQWAELRCQTAAQKLLEV